MAFLSINVGIKNGKKQDKKKGQFLHFQFLQIRT